jgi:predicted DsbA family dithiol-disulfide isomerase
LCQDYDVEVEWRAFELHPEIPPEGMPLSPLLRARLVGMSERLLEMAQEVGMPMVMPDRIPNSRRALEAAEYARAQGLHEAFHAVVFRQLYAEGQDIGRWEVLRAAAVEVGMDADAMQRETEAGNYRAAVDRQIAEARALGITGVPAYIFDDQYAVVGAQPYEVFQQAMARLALDGEQGQE